MTENEAKEKINMLNDALNEQRFDAEENSEALQIAIKALEEVQQYRAIGKVSTCRNAVEICRAMIERGIEPENIEAYIAFEDSCVKKGFTIKGLLEAADKQTEKRIEIFNGQASCPNCKHLFGGMDVIKKLITWDMPYCKNCGQKLDWSDEE